MLSAFLTPPSGSSKMNEQSADTGTTSSTAPSGMNRREAVKRGAMVTGAVGAAWTAPMVYDSFASPAAAVSPGTNFPWDSTAAGRGPGTYLVEAPRNRTVHFQMIGGGGGGGTYNGSNGGSGLKLEGDIPAKTGGRYTLTVVVAQGGKATLSSAFYTGGAGGTGYHDGGAGGSTGNGGGGGGGSSATQSCWPTSVAEPTGR